VTFKLSKKEVDEAMGKRVGFIGLGAMGLLSESSKEIRS
jgi:hypothetical protein